MYQCGFSSRDRLDVAAWCSVAWGSIEPQQVQLLPCILAAHTVFMSEILSCSQLLHPAGAMSRM